MAVIAINKILDKVQAKYLPRANVPIPGNCCRNADVPDQPGTEVSITIWDQPPKSILKGKGVDPLEHGGAVEAGGSKVMGKQALDGKQGGKDGERGNKKKGKQKKKEKKERPAKGYNAGQESRAMGPEFGGSAAGGDLGVGGAAEETKDKSWERKPKK
ncbi:hypothetical protein PAXRUDRAFT_15759 [Paxillus rubicundulus Ve08.2h10]|uniref:Uncharacterized protein n=1 Tax=Paxillus rubicundulus Ve08.2h10 TaxID=930991 RepID=A0A0D0DGS4_9AGAM|nr:hypothetical protein PAXRUDRAFT_15759 [Paxillus rubicundulus Ve08.2h10]